MIFQELYRDGTDDAKRGKTSYNACSQLGRSNNRYQAISEEIATISGVFVLT